MSEKEFLKWKRNGNFTLSHDRIHQVSNNIAEGESNAYTKKEAAEVATYHTMEVTGLINIIEAMRHDIIIKGSTALFRKWLRNRERRK